MDGGGKLVRTVPSWARVYSFTAAFRRVKGGKKRRAAITIIFQQTVPERFGSEIKIDPRPVRRHRPKNGTEGTGVGGGRFETNIGDNKSYRHLQATFIQPPDSAL